MAANRTDGRRPVYDLRNAESEGDRRRSIAIGEKT